MPGSVLSQAGPPWAPRRFTGLATTSLLDLSAPQLPSHTWHPLPAPCPTQAGSPAAAPAAEVPLPKPLRDATAVLTSASGSKVYVLGVSHVSKESCAQIEELVNPMNHKVFFFFLNYSWLGGSNFIAGSLSLGADLWVGRYVPLTGFCNEAALLSSAAGPHTSSRT